MRKCYLSFGEIDLVKILPKGYSRFRQLADLTINVNSLDDF